MLSVLLLFTDFDYSFGIFKLFLYIVIVNISRKENLVKLDILLGANVIVNISRKENLFLFYAL